MKKLSLKEVYQTLLENEGEDYLRQRREKYFSKPQPGDPSDFIKNIIFDLTDDEEGRLFSRDEQFKKDLMAAVQQDPLYKNYEARTKQTAKHSALMKSGNATNAMYKHDVPSDEFLGRSEDKDGIDFAYAKQMSGKEVDLYLRKTSGTPILVVRYSDSPSDVKTLPANKLSASPDTLEIFYKAKEIASRKGLL